MLCILKRNLSLVNCVCVCVFFVAFFLVCTFCILYFFSLVITSFVKITIGKGRISNKTKKVTIKLI